MGDYEVVLTRRNYQVACPHGGTVTCLPTTNTHRGEDDVLLDSDLWVVSGCPFALPSGPSPCVRVVWVGGLSEERPSGKNRRKLVRSPGLIVRADSVGLCLTSNGSPQGQAVIVQGLFRATWQKQLKDSVERAVTQSQQHLDSLFDNLSGGL